MAKNPKQPVPGPPSVPPEKGVALLRRQLENGKQLLASGRIREEDGSAWEAVTQEALTKAFGKDSPPVLRIMSVGQFRFPFGAENQAEIDHARTLDMRERLNILGELIEMLEFEAKLPPTADVAPHGHRGHGVFLVHGHNEALRETTARFLEKLGFPPTILHEQPNKGRTIIEKFVDHSDVGFAVVLLTGDDLGGKKGTPHEPLSHRARQNVILELGFFLGKLGRERVCALYEPGVEIPSDYSGVLFVQVDVAGAWRFALAREMKAVGFPVDMNKAI